MSAAAAEPPLDGCWTRAHPDHCTFVQGLVREVYKMLERTVPPLATQDSDEWNPLAVSLLVFELRPPMARAGPLQFSRIMARSSVGGAERRQRR